PKEQAEALKKVEKIADVTEWISGGYDVRAKKDITDDQLATIAQLPGLVSLTLWDLQKVTDAGLAHLTGAKSLNNLSLGSRGLTEAGLKHLAGLPRLGKLRVEDMKVGETGTMHLKAIPQLKELALIDVGLTDPVLSTLKGFPELTELDLSDNKEVTDAGLAG